MFSSLIKGNTIQGVDCRTDDYKWFTGTIERITPSINKQYNVIGQFPPYNLDIVVDIDGEQREFQQVPANNNVADFGEDTFILSDSKDTLYNYVKSLLRKSEDIVKSEDKHKKRIPQYKKVLSDMIPQFNDTEVKELKAEVKNLQSQLAETLALLKQEASKTKEQHGSNV